MRVNRFRCKECGVVKSIADEADRRPGTCESCADWLDTINVGEGRAWDVARYRAMYSGVVLDRPTVDWLRQNY